MKTRSFYLGKQDEDIVVGGTYYLGQLIDNEDLETLPVIFHFGCYYSYKDDTTIYIEPVTHERTIESLVRVIEIYH